MPEWKPRRGFDRTRVEGQKGIEVFRKHPHQSILAGPKPRKEDGAVAKLWIPKRAWAQANRSYRTDRDSNRHLGILFERDIRDDQQAQPFDLVQVRTNSNRVCAGGLPPSTMPA